MAYLREAFKPVSLEHAKDIALTPDASWPGKFKDETDYLVGVIESLRVIGPESLVLDFGCGMGRVARELIMAFGCHVVGVDTSDEMLAFAHEYVRSCHFAVLRGFNEGEAVDLAIASFVLQHAEYPEAAIDTIYRALKPGGTLVLLDDGRRFVPSGADAQGFVIWQDDGIDVEALIAEKFALASHYPYPNRRDQPLSIWKKI